MLSRVPIPWKERTRTASASAEFATCRRRKNQTQIPGVAQLSQIPLIGFRVPGRGHRILGQGRGSSAPAVAARGPHGNEKIIVRTSKESIRNASAGANEEQELALKNKMAKECTGARGSLRERVESNIEQVRARSASRRASFRSAELEGKRLGEEQAKAEVKREEIERLGPQSKCPTCERELCDQHGFLLEKLEKESTDRSAERERLRQEKEKNADMARQLGERLDVLDKRKKELTRKCDEAAKVEEAVERLQRQLLALKEERGVSEAGLEALGAVDFDERRYENVKGGLLQLRTKVDRFNELRTQLARSPELEEEKEQSDPTVRSDRSKALSGGAVGSGNWSTRTARSNARNRGWTSCRHPRTA